MEWYMYISTARITLLQNKIWNDRIYIEIDFFFTF